MSENGFENKYINMVVGRFLCKAKEDISAGGISMNDNNKPEQGNNPIPTISVTEIETTTTPDDVELEQALSKTENHINAPSKLASRKYPSADGIGAWIRPLRKKQ